MTEYEKRLKELVYLEFEKELQKNLENDKKIKYQKHLFENINKIDGMVCRMEDSELTNLLHNFIEGVRCNIREKDGEIYTLEYEVKALKEKLEKLTP
jgi:LytS/YehU family sensor histidine kinase